MRRIISSLSIHIVHLSQALSRLFSLKLKWVSECRWMCACACVASLFFIDLNRKYLLRMECLTKMSITQHSSKSLYLFVSRCFLGKLLLNVFIYRQTVLFTSRYFRISIHWIVVMSGYCVCVCVCVWYVCISKYLAVYSNFFNSRKEKGERANRWQDTREQINSIEIHVD